MCEGKVAGAEALHVQSELDTKQLQADIEHLKVAEPRSLLTTNIYSCTHD